MIQKLLIRMRLVLAEICIVVMQHIYYITYNILLYIMYVTVRETHRVLKSQQIRMSSINMYRLNTTIQHFLLSSPQQLYDNLCSWAHAYTVACCRYSRIQRVIQARTLYKLPLKPRANTEEARSVIHYTHSNLLKFEYSVGFMCPNSCFIFILSPLIQ